MTTPTTNPPPQEEEGAYELVLAFVSKITQRAPEEEKELRRSV
jgi:hypothetical protein